MNTLTRAGVFVEDKLFATLDPTTRALRLPNGDKVMLVDTVGFIHKIPHSLIEAFKSTLEEVSRADLLLHLVDLANPLFEEQIRVIEKVLDEIGAGELPTLLVPNKTDRISTLPMAQFKAKDVLRSLSDLGIDRFRRRAAFANGRKDSRSGERAIPSELYAVSGTLAGAIA